ncbi:Lysophospholipase L1 [Singulisphaera sp. GP187]|uniref:GDSL-type esterase/lipase family protein n=1 Tax=Singulisphaera sp. GP187 TaxID=1882752 RepID=UPI00092C9CF5|nr:GDSL-type esterase/lipase family protein [Singulisphaera sp. GP187]SIO58370.1 Lysophospholipase L1 [Singulisphaera sp. GP187]
MDGDRGPSRWGWTTRLYVMLAALAVLGGMVAIGLFSSRRPAARSGEIRADDPSLFYSPWNWYGDGSSFQTTHFGAWLKFGWTGRNLRLKVDVSMADHAGIGADAYPVIGYSIDGGPFRVLRLERGDRERTLAADLPAGRHRCQAYLRWIGFGVERWRAGRQVALWRVTGLRLDPGATTYQDPTLRPRRALFFGDSILDGAFNRGGETDAFEAWPEVVAERLDAEPGRVGFEGQSYAIGTGSEHGNVPALFIPLNPRESTWDLVDSYHPRLAAGQFAPRPDYVFLCHGVNDAFCHVPLVEVEASVRGLLPRIRAASGLSAQLFVVIPFEGSNRAPIQAAFDAYQAASPDSNCHLIDLGDDVSSKVEDLVDGKPARRSFDRLHPNSAMHARLGTMMADRVSAILSHSGQR